MPAGQIPLLTAEASAHIARRPGGGGKETSPPLQNLIASKKPHPHTKPNSIASP